MRLVNGLLAGVAIIVKKLIALQDKFQASTVLLHLLTDASIYAQLVNLNSSKLLLAKISAYLVLKVHFQLQI